MTIANGDNGAPPTLIVPQHDGSPDNSVRIPKNKSTGNLLPKSSDYTERQSRFSFDAGNSQEIHLLKRAQRAENDNVLGVSGLRRIRRQAPPLSRSSTFHEDDPNFSPQSLNHTHTLPISGSTSRSASAHNLASGPSSPAIEDLHRFPSESLHSFSFARQSEDFLHSRQTILNKSVQYMRERINVTKHPGLASAQARVTGDVEMQGMIELLRRANVLGIDTSDAKVKGLGLGPMTGPADVSGRNIFEKSFSSTFEPVEEAVASPEPEHDIFDGHPETPLERRTSSPGLEMGTSYEGGKGPRPSIAGLEADGGRESGSYPRPNNHKRTYTDLTALTLQEKLMEALAQPYTTDESIAAQSLLSSSMMPASLSTSQGQGQPLVHSHSSKWAPSAQAVFRTEASAPWTILAANDLACLIFGVTRAEVRHLGMPELIQADRRQWLEVKLGGSMPEVDKTPAATSGILSNGTSNLIGGRGGITARLLSKVSSREAAKKPPARAQTDDGSGGYNRPKNHPPTKSRGVLLCGDVIPIQRRNGTTGAASFWVLEKRGGLIWVIEEIGEDIAVLHLDDDGSVASASGDVEHIWGQERIATKTPISALLPHLPPDSVSKRTPSGQPVIRHCTARSASGINVPISTTVLPNNKDLRVSSFPHIAGMMVLNPLTLQITSSNSVFSAALFGYEKPNGQHIEQLIPGFHDILGVLTQEEGMELADGIVIPEHSFRRARALLALREGNESPANIFLRPAGLMAKHKDGSDLMVDVQMRVVKSESIKKVSDRVDGNDDDESSDAGVELMYALWITYSKQLHSAGLGTQTAPMLSRPFTPPSQPSPPALPSPAPSNRPQSPNANHTSLLSQQLHSLTPVVSTSDEPLEHPPPDVTAAPHKKKIIDDFVILEEMGSGAYGQVKLARYRGGHAKKMVIKYVTKRRILVDTWTRDRRLGTVPLEIHVMDFLRKPELRHPNIVEMVDFFEDDVNYYIEMLPHGIPGMDLFDYIELRANMEEKEVRSIFGQVVEAIWHLHENCGVVHRDIKDENVVLDGDGNVKLIDFGSAAYVKSGPFEVFVGTIDYAAPEVLQGKAYGGKEQDVWALGILLYTIVYKENPFYNIDEILDHPLRVPFTPFDGEEDGCLDLIRQMLDREVDERIEIDGVRRHLWLKSDDEG